jgi:hypothetical protein
MELLLQAVRSTVGYRNELSTCRPSCRSTLVVASWDGFRSCRPVRRFDDGHDRPEALRTQLVPIPGVCTTIGHF